MWGNIKALMDAPEGGADWCNLDVTPNVEYPLNAWLDLVADTTIGATKQTDAVDTIEVTPQPGVRLHLFSRTRRFHSRESAPRRRIVVCDLLRVESQNFIYTRGDTESDSTARFHNRLEFLASLNKARFTDDGARYVITDWEWFTRSTTLKSASQTVSASAIDEKFSTTENILNIRVKRVLLHPIFAAPL